MGFLDEHPSLRFAGEDNDWAYRALRAGIPIVYDPSAVVGHVAAARLGAAGDLSPLRPRPGRVLRQAPAPRRLFIARRVARDLLRAPWLLLRGTASGNRELLALAYGELTGLLPGLLAGLRNPGGSRRPA